MIAHVTDEELKAEYEQEGATLETLAAKYDCTREWIRQRLKAAGVQRRRKGAPKQVKIVRDRQRFTPADVQHMAELYASGKSLFAIGALLNTNAMTVRRYLLLAGVQLRGRGKSAVEKVSA